MGGGEEREIRVGIGHEACVAQPGQNVAPPGFRLERAAGLEPGQDAARAFGDAVRAGRLAFEAGVMAPQDMAVASTPVAGRPMLIS